MCRNFKGKKGKRFDFWLPEDHPFFNIPPGERSRWLRCVIEEKLGMADSTHITYAVVNTPLKKESEALSCNFDILGGKIDDRKNSEFISKNNHNKSKKKSNKALLDF